jgi:hypothetical protein
VGWCTVEGTVFQGSTGGGSGGWACSVWLWTAVDDTVHGAAGDTVSKCRCLIGGGRLVVWDWVVGWSWVVGWGRLMGCGGTAVLWCWAAVDGGRLFHRIQVHVFPIR